MAHDFGEHLKNNATKSLRTISKEDLLEEIFQREITINPFPLDVFHDNIKPFINSLIKTYDIPECFIGLSLLGAYSMGVGTAYVASANGEDKVALSLWGCLCGRTSSGKSLAMDKIFEPFFIMQKEYDKQWEDDTAHVDESDDNRRRGKHMKQVIVQDTVIATLVRDVMPDNPKGVLKYCDELVNWTNGFNPMSRGKDGTDEQFWLSTWSCVPYTVIRSGKKKYTNRRPFANVFGGIQYKVVPDLFASGRQSNGFINRLLFAKPDINRNAMVDPELTVPKHETETHWDSIKILYNSLPVEDEYQEPRLCVLSKEARKTYHNWVKENNIRINQIEDEDASETQSAIFGKIQNYALRFSALLALSDIALTVNKGWDHDRYQSHFPNELGITHEVIQRSIKLCNYFVRSATDVHEMVNVSMTAPLEVLRCAMLLKLGKSYADIGAVLYNNRRDSAVKKKVERNIKKWAGMYPKVFNAQPR